MSSSYAVEEKIRAATHDDGYKPSIHLLQELAAASNNYKYCAIIMKVLWKRLGDHGKNWKRVYKSLLVLEYLMLHGSPQIFNEVSVRKIEIQTLSMFQHSGKFDGKDVGLHLREKAKAIVDIIENPPVRRTASSSSSSSAPVSSPSAAPSQFQSANFREQHIQSNPYVAGPAPVPVSGPRPVSISGAVPVQPGSFGSSGAVIPPNPQQNPQQQPQQPIQGYYLQTPQGMVFVQGPPPQTISPQPLPQQPGSGSGSFQNPQQFKQPQQPVNIAPQTFGSSSSGSASPLMAPSSGSHPLPPIPQQPSQQQQHHQPQQAAIDPFASTANDPFASTANDPFASAF